MYEHSHIQKRDSIHIEWIHYIWRMNVCDNDAIYSNWMGCECFNFCLLSFHFGSLKELTLNNPIFFHSTDFFFSFPRLSRINMTKSSMLSWQKLFLKATYKQQKQQRQWQQKKTIKHYISPSFWNSAPPRTSLNVSHSWKQSLRCECMSTYMCVFCRSCAVFSMVLLIVTLTLSESKSIRCPTIFLSSLLLLHVQCSQLRRIIPVYICTKHHDISGRYLCSDDFFPLSSSFLSYFFSTSKIHTIALKSTRGL